MVAQSVDASREPLAIGKAERLSWYGPVLAALLVLVVRASPEPAEVGSVPIFWAGAALFLVISLAASLLAARAYVSGAPFPVLALGCGMLTLGLTSFSGMLLAAVGLSNAGITAHSLGLLLGSVAHLLGAAWLARGVRESHGNRGGRIRRLTLAYAGTVLLASATVMTACLSGLPPFVHPEGPTAVGITALGAAVMAYLVAAFPFSLFERQVRSVLLHWYWLGLVLIAIGTGAAAMAGTFTLLGWVGRASQLLGVVYVLIGLHVYWREGAGGSLVDAFDDLEDALRESEGKYHTLFSHSVDGILLTGEGGRVIAANPSACTLFGMTESQLQQVSLASLMTGAAAYAKGVLQSAANTVRQARSCHCSDGRQFEAEVTTVALSCGRRRFVIVRDISRRSRAEAAMTRAKEAAEAALAEAQAARQAAEQARAQAQRANAAKDQFIASLSHELRTPLTPVLAAASSLKDDGRLPEEVREELQMIQRNVGLEVQLIADLLDVTRIAVGKLVLDKRPVDVARVLQGAARICSAELDARNQRLTIHMPGAPYILTGDEPRLHQIFWNLIKNASKFTPPGGMITITAERSRASEKCLFESLVIRVTDTGCGLEGEAIPRLFNAFEQGGMEVTRQFGGLGLGLAICRAVVELHGGSIWAESAGVGQGATFSVELPLPTACGGLPLAEPMPEQRDAMAHAQGGELAMVRLRILLVEDHVDTARVIRRLLVAQGHQVAVAGCISEAIGHTRNAAFDLLVSDLGLPDGNGCDLLRRLCAEGKRLRAIALTGYGSAADVEASRAAGFCEHLTKPISVHSLRDAMLRACGILR